jgi:hypothetical protein
LTFSSIWLFALKAFISCAYAHKGFVLLFSQAFRFFHASLFAFISMSKGAYNNTIIGPKNEMFLYYLFTSFLLPQVFSFLTIGA